MNSAYFKFLIFTFLWVVLRFILSFDGIYSNKQLSLMLLDLLYPCIISSFLILSRHYTVVGISPSLDHRYYTRRTRRKCMCYAEPGIV